MSRSQAIYTLGSDPKQIYAGSFVSPEEHAKQSWWRSLPKILWYSPKDGDREPSILSVIQRWCFSLFVIENLGDLAKMGDACCKLRYLLNPGDIVAQTARKSFMTTRDILAFLMPVAALNKILGSIRNLGTLYQSARMEPNSTVKLHSRDFVNTTEASLQDRSLLVIQNIINIAAESFMTLTFVIKCMQTCDKWSKCLSDRAKTFTAQMSIFACVYHVMSLVRSAVSMVIDHRVYSRKCSVAPTTFAQLQEEIRSKNPTINIKWNETPAENSVRNREKMHIDHARKLTSHAFSLVKTIVELAKDVLGFVVVALKSASSSVAPLALASAALEVTAATIGIINIWLTRS